MMHGSVSTGPVSVLPMVERSSPDVQAAAIPAILLDHADCDFAGLVPQTTDKDQLDDPVPFWMIPIAPAPVALDLRFLAVPALQLPKMELVETGSLDLKTLVAVPVVVVDKSVLPEEILMPSLAQSEPAVEFVQGAVSRPPESIEPIAIKLPEPFPAVPLPEMVSASDPAPEPLVVEADIDGPALAHGPDKGAAVLSALPAPLPPVLPVPALPRATVAPFPADVMGSGLTRMTGTLSLSPDRAETILVVDALASPEHEIQLPTALMLRFESEGRAVSVRPLVLLDAQTTGERPRIEVFRPEIIASTPLTDHPEPDPKVIADPPKAERLGPGAIATALVPAHVKLPPVVLVFAKDEDDDRVTELTVPASSLAQTAGVAGPLSPAEGQKIAAPVLSPLVGQVINLVDKGSDGETTLTLSPEELGKVRLSFRPDKQNVDRMIVMLGFDRPETLELFRRHADQLADALRAAGYAGVQIGFGNTGDDNSRQPFDRALSIGGEGGDTALADEANTVLTPRRHGTLGGLDLRL